MTASAPRNPLETRAYDRKAFAHACGASRPAESLPFSLNSGVLRVTKENSQPHGALVGARSPTIQQDQHTPWQQRPYT